MSRAYTWFTGVFLMLQGVTTLLARLIPAIDQRFPALLEHTRMMPTHSALHIVTALLALWSLRQTGDRACLRFAWAGGAGYSALAILGWLSGSPLGLGLQPFDHPFHLLLGAMGLAAAAMSQRRAQSRRGPE